MSDHAPTLTSLIDLKHRQALRGTPDGRLFQDLCQAFKLRLGGVKRPETLGTWNSCVRAEGEQLETVVGRCNETKENNYNSRVQYCGTCRS